MKKLAVFSVFMLLMLCAAHKNAQAQGVVTGITFCEYNIPSNVVNGYSETVNDYIASLYYGVYTEGYLYRSLSLLQSFASGPASVSAVVLTQDPNAMQETQYDLVTDHYVVCIYYVDAFPNFYGRDVLGYNFLSNVEVPNSYPFSASGPEAFLFNTVYEYLGTTRVTVGYFPPRLDAINPNWGYERGEVNVTLSGHNLDAGTIPVQVNVSGGITATVQSVNSATLNARFQIPDNLTGQQQVTVTTTHGTSNPLNFIATDRQPQITGISPSSLDAGTVTRVTIDGTDFGVNPDLEISGVTGVQSSIVSKSDTRIVVDIGVPVDAPAGDIIITVISRGANGGGFLPGPPNTPPRSNPGEVQVRALRVTIENLGAVGKNYTANLQITLDPSPSPTGVTLTLSTTSGTGKAGFFDDTTSKTINESENLIIKGITESSTANNIRLEARAGSTTLATINFTVVEVTLSLRYGNTLEVSSDNGALNNYVLGIGTKSLGRLLSNTDQIPKKLSQNSN